MSDNLSRPVNEAPRCYLCDCEVHKHRLHDGEKSPPNHQTRDHVPPSGLFPDPKPTNLLTVICCAACNNQQSVFDDRLRIVAAMGFDRNESGATILNGKLLATNLSNGRQMPFLKNILDSGKSVPRRPDLVHFRIEASELNEGLIRITKGLLKIFHGAYDYRRATFDVVHISPVPTLQQSTILTTLLRGEYLERGNQTFQCWHHVDFSDGRGAWLLVFYGCLAFVVFHSTLR